jgi:hypothetical protein
VNVATEDDVRRVALALPGTTEKPSYGTPGFRVADRLFARVREPVEGEEHDVVVLWVSDLGEKDALLASDPERFTTTPHYDGHPTVLLRFDRVDVDELADLLEEAWRVRAPARLVAAFDAEHGAGG